MFDNEKIRRAMEEASQLAAMSQVASGHSYDQSCDKRLTLDERQKRYNRYLTSTILTRALSGSKTDHSENVSTARINFLTSGNTRYRHNLP